MNMLVVREFEFFQGEKYMVAWPCDMKGGTFGEGLQDAIESAADWLYDTALYCLIDGEDIEGGKLGHEPEHGGKVIAVAVDCDLARANAVTAADAARLLGVSAARVKQMCDKEQLISWKDGAKRMVLRESLDQRLRERPKPGRPKKKRDAGSPAADKPEEALLHV